MRTIRHSNKTEHTNIAFCSILIRNEMDDQVNLSVVLEHFPSLAQAKTITN